MKTWMLGLCLLAACTRSADPRLYTLVAAQGRDTHPTSATIEVRRPSIAGYLDRREVVRAVRSEQLDVANDANWAEPLDAMVGRVLAANLALRLPQSRVLTDLNSLGVVAELRIDTEVQRFEQGPEGLVLRAAVALRRGAQTVPVSLDVIELRDKLDGGDTGAVVGAMNVLLGQLADRVASTLVSVLASPAQGEPTPAAAVRAQ
jgi:uncharacterized lipoprotein YmbA